MVAWSAEVRNSRDLFNWVTDTFKAASFIADIPEQDLKSPLRTSLPGRKVSSAFSGIGSPEQALACIAAVVEIPGDHAMEYGVEIDLECRRELVCIKPRP